MQLYLLGFAVFGSSGTGRERNEARRGRAAGMANTPRKRCDNDNKALREDETGDPRPGTGRLTTIS
jgi:hypothetical protein